MCWTGENIPRIAQKDIKVFKVVKKVSVEECFKSVYNNYLYKIGETYKEEIIVAIMYDDYADICKGFHSYSFNKVYINQGKNCLGRYIDILTEYDCRKHMLDYFYFSRYRILFRLNCTIPKGTTYYENDSGEIVSNKLRVDSAEEIINYP